MNEIPTSSIPVSNFDIRASDLHTERLAYFCLDADCQLTTDNCKLILNRTITLKDTWAKIEKKTT